MNRTSTSHPVKRWLKHAPFCCGALLCLLPLWPAWEHWRGSREWNQSRGLLSRHALPLPGQQFDAAAADAARQLTNTAAQFPYLKNSFLVAKTPVAPGVTRSLFSVTGFSDWSSDPKRHRVTNQWADLIRAVETNRAHFALLHAALHQPHYDFGPVTNRGFFGDWNQRLLPLESARKWMVARMEVAVHQGAAREALDSMTEMVAISDALREQRVWLPQSARGTAIRQVLALTWEFLLMTNHAPDDLARLQQLLAHQEFARPMLEAVDLEWSEGGGTLQQLRDGDDSVRRRFFETNSRDRPESPVMRRLDDWFQINVAAGAWCFLFGEYAQADYAKQIHEYRAASQRSLTDHNVQPWLTVHKEYKPRLKSMSLLQMARVLPNLWLLEIGQSSLPGAFKLETEVQMARAAVAIQQYRSAHGTLPLTLADVAPEFLPQVPVDWMCGQPLHYRNDGGTNFTLYSVGLNGVDDGGSVAPLASSGLPKYFWNTLDAVWPRAATAEEARLADKR